MKLDDTKRTEIIRRLYEEDHPIERVDQINRNMDKWGDYGFVNSLVNLLNLNWRPNSWISGMFKDQQVFEGESLWCIDELIIVNAKGTQIFKFDKRYKKIVFLCSDFKTTTVYRNDRMNKVMLYGSTFKTMSYIPVINLELHSNSELQVDIAEEYAPWSLESISLWDNGKVSIKSGVEINLNLFRLYLHGSSNDVDLDLTNFNFTGRFRVVFQGEKCNQNKVRVKLNSETRFIVDTVELGDGNELSIEGGILNENLSVMNKRLKYEWRGN